MEQMSMNPNDTKKRDPPTDEAIAGDRVDGTGRNFDSLWIDGTSRCCPNLREIGPEEAEISRFWCEGGR